MPDERLNPSVLNRQTAFSNPPVSGVESVRLWVRLRPSLLSGANSLPVFLPVSSDTFKVIFWVSVLLVSSRLLDAMTVAVVVFESSEPVPLCVALNPPFDPQPILYTERFRLVYFFSSDCNLRRVFSFVVGVVPANVFNVSLPPIFVLFRKAALVLLPIGFLICSVFFRVRLLPVCSSH